MLKLSSIMLGSTQQKVMADFYEKVFEKKPDMVQDGWAGWMTGAVFFSVGEHSEMKGKAKEAGRVMFDLETDKVKDEFERLKKIGAVVIKEPYEMQETWIATLADPDGNYFQLMSPWKG